MPTPAFCCAPVSPRRAQGSTKKVAHAHGLSDFSLAAIPSLRKFKWGWAFNSDDAVVMNLVRGRELLEELDLSSAEGMGEYSSRSGLTDQLLIELGKSCPRLHTLRLQGHLQFTSEVRVRAFERPVHCPPSTRSRWPGSGRTAQWLPRADQAQPQHENHLPRASAEVVRQA